MAINGVSSGNGKVEFIDITGRKVFSEEIHFTGTAFARNYKLELNYGVYFVKISFDKGESRVQRFVVEE